MLKKHSQRLKTMLTSAPTLSVLSEGELILDTDANGTAIEAVLSHGRGGAREGDRFFLSLD